MKNQITVENVKVNDLNAAPYNPRKWSEHATDQLTESIKRFGLVDPVLVNSSPKRKNIVIGGHFRLKVAKDLSYEEVPVVYLDIPDKMKERELNLRLNKNLGDWDYELLAQFDESLLVDIGFDSVEMDEIFDIDTVVEEQFDLKKELEKLNIAKVEAKKGEVYQLSDSRLMIGDSTIKEDIVTLTI